MQTKTNIVRILLILILIGVPYAPLAHLSTPAMAQATMSNEVVDGFGLKLALTGLEDLGEGWAYEGWLIVDDAPVSIGLFTVDGEGNLSADTFAVSGYAHANATAFVLTIEPSPDDDPAPSTVHLLGGDFTNGAADLSIGHAAALGADLADAAGSYIIGLGYLEGATVANDYTHGIWFPNSLDLPDLADGWIYEGWVVGADGPISTGRFTDPNAMDQDGSGNTAGGPGTGPNFPGQDFLYPPVSLIGDTVVISVEPEPDNSAAPFTLKPLIDPELEDVGDHGSQELMNNAAASSPTGTATLVESLLLEINGLADLDEGWAYEGWLIVDGAPVSTGLFTIDADGNLPTDALLIKSSDRANATTFVLTIEPSPDDDPAPSSIHLLGGDFVAGVANLSIGHPSALATDFADATGSYIIGLGYPEGATAANHYTNGIWYLNSLNLPELADGWVYEGWVVGADGPISTGRFTDPNAMDQDGTGPTAGGFGTGPAFPGQDFLDPPVDLIGYAAVISVEPEPDNSAAPFALKPLLDPKIDDVGDHGSQPMRNNAEASSPTGTALFAEPLLLDISGLEDLGAGWVYEGWLIVDDTPVSAGLFTVDAEGQLSTNVFMVNPLDARHAAAFVLTIEPSPDDDPAPSAVHALGGDFSNGMATLSVAHPAALGDDFSNASGSYVLAAPSGGADQPYVNGIWWFASAAAQAQEDRKGEEEGEEEGEDQEKDPKEEREKEKERRERAQEQGPAPALTLPNLPAGWVYEGWVVGTDGPISTGRFTSVKRADSDAGGPAAGPEEVPSFPGQDFVDPALDLTSGYAAVISVEPEPDNSPAPFAYKPLLDPEIEDVGADVLQAMAPNLETLATGTVIHMAADMSDSPVAEAMPTTSGNKMTIVAQGEFMPVNDDYHGEGTATIYEAEETQTLRLTEFQVSNGPALHVLLIENAAAVSNSELGAYVDLGPLKGNVGDQNYTIPADVDLAQYNGVMIYCMPFHAAFATAAFAN